MLPRVMTANLLSVRGNCMHFFKSKQTRNCIERYITFISTLTLTLMNFINFRFATSLEHVQNMFKGLLTCRSRGGILTIIFISLNLRENCFFQCTKHDSVFDPLISKMSQGFYCS